MHCAADGRRLAAVTKFGECGIWELDTDGYKVSGVRLPPFDQSALASSSAKAVVLTEKSILVADLVSGNKAELAVDKSNRACAVATTGDGGKVAVGQQMG